MTRQDCARHFLSTEGPHEPFDGDCFAAALHLGCKFALHPDMVDAPIYVVHGEALLRPPGASPVRSWHAWVELGGDDGVALCVDASSGRWKAPVTCPADVYYRLGEIDAPTRMPLPQAVERALESGHYGPWTAEGE